MLLYLKRRCFKVEETNVHAENRLSAVWARARAAHKHSGHRECLRSKKKKKTPTKGQNPGDHVADKAA